MGVMCIFCSTTRILRPRGLLPSNAARERNVCDFSFGVLRLPKDFEELVGVCEYVSMQDFIADHDDWIPFEGTSPSAMLFCSFVQSD